jgi:hypothetical protein
MIAKISFTVYQNYEQYISEENDYEYDKALEVLNEELKDLVEKGILAYKYGGKPVEIKLPITMSEVGNIFGEEDYDGPNWDGVDIPCEINIDPRDFDSSKLKVVKRPYYMDPKCILY